MKHLLFFDIDGTLAIGQNVPESTKEALRKVRDNGNLVFICTGRALGYVEKYFSEYADGFICSNGRFGILNDEILYDHPLTKKQVKEIVEDMKHLGAGLCFFEQRHAYYEGTDEGYNDMAIHWPEGFIKRGIDIDTISPYNFDIDFKDMDHFEMIKKYCKDKYLFNLHLPSMGADTTILGYDKGTALKAIAQRLEVPLENTYAFGDGLNDIVMLKAAGVGVAMGNATEETKQSADYVTTDINEEGIKNALVHFGLIDG